MTPLDALLELLERVGASRDAAALVSDEELSRWPESAVLELKSQKLLVKASPAASVVCPGCEQACAMPVHTLPAGARPAISFVVCDKRNDISRVEVPAQRLRQWRCGAEAVGAFVGGAWDCGLRASRRRKPGCGSLAF